MSSSLHDGARDIRTSGLITGRAMGKKESHAAHDGSRSSNCNRKVPGNGPASNLLLFARNFLRYPNRVGWVFPSSRFLVQQVLKQIDWDRAKTLVEYGP